jgi:Tfp pilus assembly protein PilN
VLRTNLSTRPFYNERAVHAVLAAVAIVLLAVTAWQVARIVSLSREKTELSASINRDRGQAVDLSRKAADIRRGLNQTELQVVAAEAKEANQLITQRTFSWTELFNQLEATLPPEVMLVSVHPEFKDGRIDISMEIQGRRTEDIVDFFDRLEKTGDFRNVTWQAENVTDEGLQRMIMSAVYAPHAGGRP